MVNMRSVWIADYGKECFELRSGPVTKKKQYYRDGQLEHHSLEVG